MSKPKEIHIEGKKYFAWPYEEQTQVKHKVLESYAKIWISKLGYKQNTLFFDCHGGCGAYISEDGNLSYGSSIIVKNIADEISKKRNTKTGIYYCELLKKNYENFLDVVNDCGNPRIVSYNKPFEDVIADTTVSKYYNKYPTLFLVDPFGYKFCIDNLSLLMKGHGNEIILNFMFDFINRFLSNASLETTYNNFFGSDKWKEALSMKEKEREDFLVKIFREKMKEITKAKYVFPYRLCYPDKDQTYYYLFHATNHIDGITLMKEAFAGVNNGRVQYLGKYNKEISFWDLSCFKSEEIFSLCLIKYKGKRISFGKLWSEVVEDIAYTSKDLSQALVELEQVGKVKVTRVSSVRGRYKESDIIEIL